MSTIKQIFFSYLDFKLLPILETLSDKHKLFTMIARTKDGIRMAIDIIVIFPSIFVLAVLILDNTFRNNSVVPICIWATFFLLLGILINKWLKPLPFSEQLDRLREEELFLSNKISNYNRTIAALKRIEEDKPGSKQTDINAQLMRIKEKEGRIEYIQTKRKKLEILKA